MQATHIVKEIEINRTFRVAQVASMFDVPLENKARQEWQVNLPLEDFPEWQIGLIIGPSGCGKSTIARELWPSNYICNYNWDNSLSVLDNFPKALSAKEITAAFTLVGFSSPPEWIKPYSVLSTGQRMRCDLARALLQDNLIVFDEFTSVVDRNVAKIGSMALSKAIRKKEGKQFIAVTCHEDVLEWLDPDWVYEPQTNSFSRRLLRQRPQLNLEIYRTTFKSWVLFEKYHYLSNSISKAAQCFIAFLENKPVAFLALLNVIGFTGVRRISRIVVLPDYQGVGVGSAFCNWAGEYLREQNIRCRITTSHPGFIAYMNKSEKWMLAVIAKTGNHAHSGGLRSDKTLKALGNLPKAKVSVGRSIVTFEFAGSE
jgi:energy-coupling factor transporter ATP-binding protein EcfA2